MFSCPTHASVGQPNGGAEDLKEATWMQQVGKRLLGKPTAG